MSVIVRNIVYSININTPLCIILKYLLNYLYNLIILKKKFNKIISFQKKIENLKAKKKIAGFTKVNILYSIPIFDSIIKKNLTKDNLYCLILGTYEGNSTLFFSLYNKTWKFTCVDLWNKKKFAKFNIKAENFFNSNTKEFKNRINKIKSSTKHFFKENKNNYDFIYLDSSHKSKDVEFDSINAWNILNKDGIFIIHSLFWRGFKNLYNNNLHGVNLFLKKIKANNFQIINVTNNFLALKKL